MDLVVDSYVSQHCMIRRLQTFKQIFLTISVDGDYSEVELTDVEAPHQSDSTINLNSSDEQHEEKAGDKSAKECMLHHPLSLYAKNILK